MPPLAANRWWRAQTICCRQGTWKQGSADQQTWLPCSMSGCGMAAAAAATPAPLAAHKPSNPLPSPRPSPPPQLNITCLIPPERINYGTVALAVEVFQPLPNSNDPVEVRASLPWLN